MTEAPPPSEPRLRDWDDISKPPEKKKKSGTGATAMRHARAIVALRWPGQPTFEASKRIVWIPTTECPACGRGLTPRSMAEDIFGVFDIAIVGFGVVGGLVQVTTGTAGTVAPRKRKIERWLDTQHPVVRSHCDGTSLCPQIEVWAWIARSYMRRWRLDHTDPYHWRELAPVESPEIKKRKRAA